MMMPKQSLFSLDTTFRCLVKLIVIDKNPSSKLLGQIWLTSTIIPVSDAVITSIQD
jgi:hypothetical protein